MKTNSSTNEAMSSAADERRGPDGCRYDDEANSLSIQLVVRGIREKSLMKASNTSVYLKSDDKSLSCTIEIAKVDKKKKPPVRTVLDSRYFEIPKFPSEISDVTFKLKKDCCALTIRKKYPQIWGNDISQYGL